jgi:hypothetical protein
MTGHNTAVFGVFRLPSQAEKVVSRLTSAGFSNSEVTLLESNIDGLLSGMGISENKAKRYEGFVKEGSILLSVNCSNSLEIDRANIILKQNGAEHISWTGLGEQVVSTHEVHQP